MSVQAKPYTFFNNTTADANEVNADFDVIYALQSGNIDAANMNMTSDFNFTGALQHNGFNLLETLAVIGAINGKTVAATNLYTVPTGKSCVVIGAVIRPTTMTAVSGTLEAGIGVAAGEDDIFPPTLMPGLDAVGECYVFWNTGMRVVATAGQIIKLGIDTGFGGTTATLEVRLLGFLF